MLKTFSGTTYLIHARTAVVLLLLAWVLPFCRQAGKPPEKDIVKKVEQLVERTGDNLKKLIGYANDHKAAISDAVKLRALSMVTKVYEGNQYQAVWSTEDQWKPIAASLVSFVHHAKEYGLYPGDYHDSLLTGILNTINADPASRKNAALWARADVLYTDAYLQLAKDIKLGRLKRDSVTLRTDSLYMDDFFIQHFNEAVSSGTIPQSLEALEPKYPQYTAIRQELGRFLDTADLSPRTYLVYPSADSMAFMRALQQRLMEEGLITEAQPVPDSVLLSEAIIKYQQSKGMKVTGIISASVVKKLDNTDMDKFNSIAITLDGYKMLPEALPDSYILVNIPSYTLYVYNKDTLVFDSKVIVGTPATRTPLLNGRISNFITYPQWTVPYSIIFRDMLPKIQRDIGYLSKQNLMVVDRNDNVLDPATINWMKLGKEHFPYLIRQKEGDDNSLGVIKFNFANKYNVYLHDTNARTLFSRSKRALSHGCVRVQEWEALSHFLTRADTARFPADTLDTWMMRQEKHVVSGFPRVPVFTRYFLVEEKEGSLVFYDDIYGYGGLLKRRYFADRRLN